MERNFDLYQLQYHVSALPGRRVRRVPAAVTNNRIKYVQLRMPTVTGSDHLQWNSVFDLYQL